MMPIPYTLIHQIARQFTLEFIADPYLCYTEHGQHALFYMEAALAQFAGIVEELGGEGQEE